MSVYKTFRFRESREKSVFQKTFPVRRYLAPTLDTPPTILFVLTPLPRLGGGLSSGSPSSRVVQEARERTQVSGPMRDVTEINVSCLVSRSEEGLYSLPTSVLSTLTSSRSPSLVTSRPLSIYRCSVYWIVYEFRNQFSLNNSHLFECTRWFTNHSNKT